GSLLRHRGQGAADRQARLLGDGKPALAPALVLAGAGVVLGGALALRLAGVDAVAGDHRHLLQLVLWNGVGLGVGGGAEETGDGCAEKQGAMHEVLRGVARFEPRETVSGAPACSPVGPPGRYILPVGVTLRPFGQTLPGMASPEPSGKPLEEAPAPLGPSPGRSAEDRLLLARIAAGDEKAFLSLVEHNHRAMVRVALSYVPSEAIAEEVVQEAWIGILQGISKFEGRCPLRAWMFRILVNC